jgi:hypothetical protein
MISDSEKLHRRSHPFRFLRLCSIRVSLRPDDCHGLFALPIINCVFRQLFERSDPQGGRTLNDINNRRNPLQQKIYYKLIYIE